MTTDPHRFNPDPHYRLYLDRSNKPVVICVQDFDYYDYDEDRILSPQAWDVEADADAALVAYIRAIESEPPDGTWIVGRVGDDGNGSVFRRDDAEGHYDPDRIRSRRWWDYSASEWIDWPTAWSRGADPQRRLYEGWVAR